MFVTPLGMVSLQEAVYHGVPLLGIPITFEQKINADIVTSKNIGRVMQLEDLTVDSLMDVVDDLLVNTTYRANVRTLSSLAKNARTSPLEDAIWWSEHVMEHKGCDHLKSPHR